VIPPLEIRGRGATVRFPAAILLAPMDGVTDASFRGLVLDLGDAGGAVTEFVRITTGPMSPGALRRELGPPRREPVGLQVMTPGPEHLAETAARAAAAGAAWLDINFGCPAKRVFNKCAGSALLAHPGRIEAIVAAAVAGTDLPVSAKVRAGIEDDARLEEILDAAAGGGAAMVTLHARLRRDSYAAEARWERVARGAAFLASRHPSVALVGNGGIDRAADAGRMIRETGCGGVMVGRAALADPWIFREARGGPPGTAAEAAAFAARYLDALSSPGSLRGGIGKAKQLVRTFRAGGLFAGREAERARLLREAGLPEIRAWFAAAAETVAA
jgi:tRNA-dihydrouridine synthase C